MKWNKREKTLLLVCVVLFVAVVVKSLFIDGYTPMNQEEEKAIEKVHEVLGDSLFIQKKVVNLKKISEETKKENKVDLGYMIVLRKYLFGIIPTGESRVLV